MRGRAIQSYLFSLIILYPPPVIAAMAFSYVTALHNRLAKSGEESYISYEESSEGHAHAATWTAKCKFRDEVKGTGKGATKVQAREGAAKQALEKMGFTI